ncbi:MAG TPA: hypothetical protein VFF98_11195 [Novosphingobium sp.]|nr:hypothetical protein [Novosphingobium sp.]HZV11006.1 hypothetical protein [Novosphingobium sp.]
MGWGWAQICALSGAGAAALALGAWWADRRHMRRRQLDRVGLVVWRDVAFWATVAALLAWGAALRLWAQG